MKRFRLHLLPWAAGALCLALSLPAMFLQSQEGLDWGRVRQVLFKSSRGEKLTEEENRILERARQSFGNVQIPPGGMFDQRVGGLLSRKQQLGLSLTPEEKAYLELVMKADLEGGARGGKDSVELVPLCDLGSGTYKGESGGLYGGAQNEPPASHWAAALREAARIQPLDAQGMPAKEGRIALLSIGMSNTTQEFSTFKEIADRDPAKASNLVIVDGAQDSQAAEEWVIPDKINPEYGKPVWDVAGDRLAAAGVTARQVQVLFIKQALIREGQYGEFPAHSRRLEADVVRILQGAKERFANLRIAYLTGRIYGGYATTNLNPEPYAYETGFGMRWVIQKQIQGDPELNFNPARGVVRAPLVLWGPYLWADGMKPRKLDGLVWERKDLVLHDGTHPSISGRQKVARLLLQFFKTDETARPWFVNGAKKAAGPSRRGRRSETFGKAKGLIGESQSTRPFNL
jgi:hypothetical protein